MSNLEFFSRVLLGLILPCFYALFFYIMDSWKKHISILCYELDHREVKLNKILGLYRANINKLLFVDLDPGFSYELICVPVPKMIIHFYRTSIEVKEGTHLYYFHLGLFDFIRYQVYYFIIFRFTAKKPNITLKNLKYDKSKSLL